MIDLGVVRPGSTIRIPFSSFDKDDGSSITMTNYAAADILVYKDGNTTERASTSGYTATTDFDSKTGKHLAVIDLSDNTTSAFWNAGSEYLVAVDAVTIDAVTTGGWIARFVIGYPNAVINTTIATLASQTSFTLTSGPAEDNALVNFYAIIHDIASAVQLSKVLITAYTGSTKTVTLAAGATFTASAGDNISIIDLAPLQATTAGNTLDVTATGEAGVDWGNVGSKTTTNALTNTTIATTQKVDVETIKTNPVVNGGTITFPTGATLASTTNITAGTIANVTTVNGLAANVITAASIATDAIGASELAADAVTEIRSLASGTSDSGTTTTMVDAARTEADADYWKGQLIVFTSGNILGQARVITAFDAATDTITFAPATTQAVSTQTYEIWPVGDYLRPTTSGRTLDVSAGGEAGLDWANVGSPTTALALTGTTIATTQKVDLETIKTQAVTCAGGVTVPAATLASTTNITAATGVDITKILGTAISTPATAGILDVNAKNINNVATTSVTTINANQGTTQPVNFTGTGASALAKSDMVDVAGAAVSTSSAQIGVNAVNLGGTAQTGRDIGASVLLSSGTGAGQLDFTSGVVKSNLVQILGTALTETAGLIAAGFKKFFNVATPTGTLNSLPGAAPDAAGGLPISDAGGLDVDAQRADVAAILVDTGTTLDGRLPAALTAGGKIKASMDEILAVAQSATDLKDFADDGYDPSTNKVQGVVLTDTLTTYTGNTPQTGDVFPLASTEIADIKAKTDLIPAAPASTTNITAGTITTVTNLTNAPTAGDLTAAMKASVNAEVDTALADYDGPTHAELVSEIDAVQTDIAGLNDLSSAQVETAVTNAILGGLARTLGAVVDDAGNSASTFLTGFTETDDNFWMDAFLTFIDGDLAGQTKKITAYDGTTKFITTDPFTAEPADGDTFLIVNV